MCVIQKLVYKLLLQIVTTVTYYCGLNFIYIRVPANVNAKKTGYNICTKLILSNIIDNTKQANAAEAIALSVPFCLNLVIIIINKAINTTPQNIPFDALEAYRPIS